MKRWAIGTVVLYFIALLVLSAPVIYFGAANWDLSTSTWWLPRFVYTNLAELYFYWGYWLWLAVLLLGQILLLLVPMDIAAGRPVARRKLKVPVLTSAFLFANLFFAGIFCLLFAQYGDAGPDKILFWTGGPAVNVASPSTPEASLSNYQRTMLGAAAMLLVLWIVWAFVFHVFTRKCDEQTLMKRLLSWLLTGSILEFLVAVPSHVIVRGRNDCCAPAGTFWGIATGLSIMLLCFGPGVLLLYKDRIQKKLRK